MADPASEGQVPAGCLGAVGGRPESRELGAEEGTCGPHRTALFAQLILQFNACQ